MRALFMVVCAALLFAGSPCLYSENAASRDDTYVLHVELVECDVSHFTPAGQGEHNVSGFSNFIQVNGRTQEVNGITHDEMVAFQDSKVVKFPDLELVPGQQREINRQKPVKYPSAFDAEGTPTEFKTRGVGLIIRATILAATNSDVVAITTNSINLSYHVEDVTGPLSTNEVEKIKAANSKMEIKGACFNIRARTGSIGLPLGQWSLPDLFTASGKSRYMAWFLKIENK